MGFFAQAGPTFLLWTSIFFIVVIPASILVHVTLRVLSDASLPSTLPWAGVDTTILAEGGLRHRIARARAMLRSFFGMKSLLNDGYTKYSKQEKPYVLPHILTGPEVVLPVSQVRWLISQPDTVLCQTDVNRQFLEADHTFLHPNIVREPVHPDVIRRELTHRLGTFTDDIVEELDQCLLENWGVDTENWREVHVYDTMLDVISRLSTRVFVGKELCDNKEFLHAARSFDRNVVLSAAALNLMPGFLKPILGPVVTVYDYVQYRICARHVLPDIKKRLSEMHREEKLPLFERRGPNDYIQWAIGHALNHWDPLELTANVIMRRLACLCFAAIQSSVISITNTIFDVASSPHCGEWLAAMRDEVVAAQADTNGRSDGPWSKAALARMTRVDSALRESMRLNGFVARGIMKTVVAKDGVTLPDGTHLPRGAKVGIQAYNVHRDEDIYARAEEYEAFRFAAPVKCEGDVEADGSSSGSDSEASNGSAHSRRRRASPGAKKVAGGGPAALVSTSPTFLAFSHGPNACPGRFFAANQLKLTLAHIALHYEIEPIPHRPGTKWFVGSMAPPMWTTLRVRRRKL